MPSDPRQVLKRPLVTEKNTHLQERNNQYVFLVHPDANKIQIRKAVEELFDGVKVTQVRTHTRIGKPRRTFGRFHHTATTKRAIVTLRQGDTIETM